MEDSIYIRMVTTLLIDELLKALRSAAEETDRINDDEYNENVFLIGMIGNSIATGKDKMYIIELLKEIAQHQIADNDNWILEQAKRHIKDA